MQYYLLYSILLELVREGGKMWILLWIQLATNEGIKYYHVDTFGTEKECQTALSKAKVIVSSEREQIACLYVENS